MTYAYDVLGVSSAFVLLLVAVFLLQGPFRKFPVVLAYVAWVLLAETALTIADVLWHGSAQLTSSQAQRLYARFYWTDEVVVGLLQFLLVIVLTYQATAERAKRAVVRLLGGVVAATLVLPFLIFQPNFMPWPTRAWFNSTSELLNFGAAIMNLVLWGTLIASRERDRQLLTVSAGLGVVVTGVAISYGLRHFIPPGPFEFLVNLFLMLSQLCGWTILCWAFWPAPKLRRARRDALTSP